MRGQRISNADVSSEARPTPGPHVFLDYDQDALDRAYDQSAYAPNAAQLGRRRASLSRAARDHLREPQRLSYGPTDIERLDLFLTARTPAPAVVYVHGGAWHATSAANFHFPAELFLAAGAHYLALDFIGVEDAGGSLLTMADQVRRAFAWIARNAEPLGIDPGRIYLAGHSSGAHLGSCVLITDWREYGLDASPVRAALLSSGMYELQPVSLSKRSQYVAFTPEMIERLSVMRQLDRIDVPLVVAYGSLETPEFQRQAREFGEALQAAGKRVQLLVGEEMNHFEILETLASPFGLLGRAALNLFELKL